MSSPHESKRSREALGKSFEDLEKETDFQKPNGLAGLGMLIKGRIRRSHILKENERNLCGEAYTGLLTQMERLGFVHGRDVCHRVTDEERDTWVVAVGAEDIYSLEPGHIRFVVNSETADGSLLLQDVVVSPNRHKVNTYMRIVSQDPTSNDRKSVRCPPRFDIASFINGNGVKLNQHPSYNMPVPYTFTERLGTELPELTQQLTELSGLLSTLNDLTQQTAPEWPRGHDTL